LASPLAVKSPDRSPSNTAEALPASQRVSKFATQELERAGLVEIGEKLRAGVGLHQGELERLADRVSPLHLAKLVELVYPLRQDVLLRPVCHLPLAQLIEETGRRQALQSTEQEITTLAAKLAPGEMVHLALDRWNGKFPPEDLLGVLQGVSLSTSEVKYTFLGPSTAEVRLFTKTFSGAEEDQLMQALGSLLNAGVATIEGGDDLQVLKAAASCGFFLHVGQKVSCVPKEGNGQGSSHAPKLSGTFLSQLQLIQTELAAARRLSAWFPGSEGPLDSENLAPHLPLGLQLLRAISLGRLLLPEAARIRAPLSLLGIKLAHTALLFGADDLGFAALDNRTAQLLGVPLLREVKETVEGHTSDERLIVQQEL